MQKFFTFKNIFILVALLLIAFLLYSYLSIFMPLILAFFTALILEPLVQLVQRLFRISKRLPAVIIVFILFVMFITTIFYLAITRLVNQVIKFLDGLPYYIADLSYIFDVLIYDIGQAVAEFPPVVIQELENQQALIRDKAVELTGNMIPLLVNIVQSVPNYLIIGIIYLLTLFLISMDLPNLKERFYARFKEETQKKVRYMTHRLGYVMIGFFKAQFLVSIVIFIVSYIGLLIIAPRNALLIALIIWLIDFIPFIGSIIILAPWAIYSFIVGNVSLGVQLIILAVILLALRRTLEPMIMGDQIGLSALATLISIYLGLYFLGVIGLIIGPLIVITIKSAMEAGIIKTDFKI